MASTSSIRPPFTQDRLESFAKPNTPWDQLTIAPNAAQFNTYRKTGGVFFLVAAVSTLGTIVILPFSSRRTTLLMYSGLGIVIMAVVGRVLRALGNTEGILSLREEVQKNIEKLTLVNIRQTYPDPNVISDQEINAWARYFLHTQPFEDFLRTQGSSIFNFKLEPSTKALIKEKYFYCIYHPSDPKNISLYSNVLESPVFSPEERAAIQTFLSTLQRNLPDPSLGKAIETFKTLKEAADTRRLSPNLYPVYAWLRGIYIWYKKVGIVEANVKQEFGTAPDLSGVPDCFKSYSVERYLADRDAKLDFDQFVANNGIDAINQVSILPCFLRFVLQQDLGLVETFKRYKTSIERFGAEKQVREAVLQQEWEQLSRFNYTQIRDRNGEDAITELTDPEVIGKLKVKFLGLPPIELSNQEKYKKEIKALGITDKQIETELSKTWGDMSYERILSLPPAACSRILTFSKKAGKGKAIDEIKHLPVMKVLDTYLQLFTDGILELADYDFKAKIESLAIEHFSPLIQKHWKFLFDSRLLTKQAYNLQLFMGSFVYQQQNIFLFSETLPKDGVWEMIETHGLISEALIGLRRRTNTAIQHETQQHALKLERLQAQYDNELNGIPQAVQVYNTRLVQAHTLSQIRLRQAESAHAAAFQALSGFQDETRRWEAEVATKRQAYEKDSQICTELESIPTKLKQLAESRQTKQHVLRDLEDRLKEQNQRSATVATLERGIEELNDYIYKAELEKNSLADRRDRVFAKLRELPPEPPPGPYSSPDPKAGKPLDSANSSSAPSSTRPLAPVSPYLQAYINAASSPDVLHRAGSSMPVSGPSSQSDRTTEEVVVPSAVDRLDSSRDKPSKQEQLQRKIEGIDREVDAIVQRIKDYRTQIVEKNEAIKKALLDFSSSERHTKITQEIALIREEYQELEARQAGIQQIYDYQTLKSKLKRSNEELERVPSTRTQKAGREEELQKAVQAALREKNAASHAEQEAAAKLNDSTVADRLKREAAQKYKDEMAREKQRFSEATERIKTAAREELSRVLRKS